MVKLGWAKIWQNRSKLTTPGFLGLRVQLPQPGNLDNLPLQFPLLNESVKRRLKNGFLVFSWLSNRAVFLWEILFFVSSTPIIIPRSSWCLFSFCSHSFFKSKATCSQLKQRLAAQRIPQSDNGWLPQRGSSSTVNPQSKRPIDRRDHSGYLGWSTANTTPAHGALPEEKNIEYQDYVDAMTEYMTNVRRPTELIKVLV